MKKWIPVASVIVAIVLLYNVIPKYVTYFLIFILITLVLNKWEALAKYFK